MKKKIFPKNVKECDKTDCFKQCGYMKIDKSGGKCTAPDFDRIEEKQKEKQRNLNWKNNQIQFPRLIAELEAAGAFSFGMIMRQIGDSMDLTRDEILEVVERASNEWDKIKGKL